ncbi:MAG: aspartyl/asparaginyl beta-hydroxylase (cupin superfamily) [Parasphingorhabdus sp.]
MCPESSKIIDNLNVNTHFGFVYYSELAPGSNITPHYGASNLRLRCHLGLEIPEQESTCITVGGISRNWVQNQSMFFDDAYLHHVNHSGNLPRTVLIIDLWHPNLKSSEVSMLSNPLFADFGKFDDTTAIS